MDTSSTRDAPDPFAVHDCAMLVMTTKLRAHDLREFRDGLRQAPEGSLYHHFWGRLLRPSFDEPEYSNDFAAWAYHALGEKALAERLSVINPSAYADLEAVREELIEVVEVALDELPHTPYARAEHDFYFTQAQLVVFDTGLRFSDPFALAVAAPDLPTSAVYYHFIDARRRTDDRTDDFTRWLRAFDPICDPVCTRLANLDPYFSAMAETRRQVADILAPLARPEGAAASEPAVTTQKTAPPVADEGSAAPASAAGRRTRPRGRKRP